MPQGPDASAILGNFYLLPVDRALHHLPVRPLRFQDDLKIFGDSPQSLRRALRDINRIMRGRHLNISVRKTKLLSGEEILDEFEDSEKDAIQYGLILGDPGVPNAVRALFDRAVSEDPVNARDLRFAVHRLQKLDDPHAAPWVLDHLPEVPYLAPILVDYLSHHQGAIPAIEERVAAYLADEEQNIYPYVEMQLVRMLAKSASIEGTTRDTLWAIVRDQNKARYVREHAIRSVGRHAAAGDVALLRTMFTESTDTPVRRALIVAITEAAGVDKGWLTAMGRSDGNLITTCEFLRKGAHLPAP